MPSDDPLRGRWRVILAVVVLTQLLVAVGTGVAVYAGYQHLDHNIKAGPPISHVVPKPKKETGPKGPLNILVMGLDTRTCIQPDGSNPCHIDGEQGGDGSDTTILLHISADRKTVYGISIPRDALVRPVPCTKNDLYTNGHGVHTDLVEWNTAYTVGGAPCTAQQVEGNFGVHVDGYITINFGGFVQMVTKLGGVDVCIPVDLDDPTYEHFDFKASPDYHLNGPTALKYVRLRHVLNGDDPSRIKRQQYFISQMIKKVKSAGTLSEPTKLYSFANAFVQALTVDPDLAAHNNLEKLAWQLHGVDLSNIRFITIPSANYPNDGIYYYRVQILQAAYPLMKKVEADQPLGAAVKGAQSAGGKKNKHPGEQAKIAAANAGLCS